MKRFLQVVVLNKSEENRVQIEKVVFEKRCSCAVACGYVPCGNHIDLKFLTQSFYDPEGKATIICGHCAKCESCEIAPEEDAYCSHFEDVCYQEEE